MRQDPQDIKAIARALRSLAGKLQSGKLELLSVEMYKEVGRKPDSDDVIMEYYHTGVETFSVTYGKKHE